MATVNPPAPAPAAPTINLTPLYILLTALIVVFAGFGTFVLYEVHVGKTPTVPASPIPADAKAHLLGEIAAFRTVAAKIDAKTVNPDATSIAAAIVDARKPVSDKLSADLLIGSPSANLRALADAEAKLVRGAK